MASTGATAVPVTPPEPAASTTSGSPPALGGVGLKPHLPPHTQPIPISPSGGTHPANLGASPSRIRSASPRRHSPASSEIFERNVQEPPEILQLQGELSPAHIPSHVITEDHIPPALEASAQAITSEELNPDEVEIVMSAAHQPAASVLEASTSHADLTQLNSPLAPLQQVRSDDSGPTSLMHQSISLPHPTEEDGASNYGELDPTDVRRLSFISFADVVQSEHQHAAPPSGLGSELGSRDHLHGSSSPPVRGTLRSGTTSTSGGVTTPPLPGLNVTSAPLDQSPPLSSVTSPMPPPPSPHHKELTIQTMRQAVRKTASGDLSAARSSGMSPVSEDPLHSGPRSRTNS